MIAVKVERDTNSTNTVADITRDETLTNYGNLGVDSSLAGTSSWSHKQAVKITKPKAKTHRSVRTWCQGR